MTLEEIAHRSERSRKVLLVAIEISDHVAGGTGQATIDGVIHPLILFDEGFDALIPRQPIKRAVVGLRVLHDVLEFDAILIGDRSDAQFQPLGTAETWGDD